MHRTVEKKNNKNKTQQQNTIKLRLCVCVSRVRLYEYYDSQCVHIPNNRSALIQRYCCCDFSLFAAIVVFGIVAVVVVVAAAVAANVVANKSIEDLHSFCCLALETISRKFALPRSLSIYSFACLLPTHRAYWHQFQPEFSSGLICAVCSAKREALHNKWTIKLSIFVFSVM